MEAMLIELSHVGKECPLRREACFACQPVQDFLLRSLAAYRIAFQGAYDYQTAYASEF